MPSRVWVSLARAKVGGCNNSRPAAPAEAFRKFRRLSSISSLLLPRLGGVSHDDTLVSFSLRKANILLGRDVGHDDPFVGFSLRRANIILGQEYLAITVAGITALVLRSIQLDIMRCGILPGR